TSVGSYAFSKCSSLSNVKLPANLSGISDYTFSDCSALKSITLPNTVTAIGKYTFSGCSALETISIPDSVTSVGSYAFSKCSSLSNVKLPANLSGISDYTFSDCSALKSITLPNTVTDIYKYAFSGCSALETISIPDNVTSIGEYAFSNCSSLSTVNIPQNLTTIGKKAFNYCKTLEEIQFNALALTDFSTSSNIFYNAGKGSNGIDVIFGDNVKKIPAYLFYVSDSLYSPNIISVSIPSSVTSIGNYAFYNCTHIEKIQFNSLSLADFSTSSNVFYNAGKDSNGIDVIFGDNVKKIPAYLFYSSNSKIVSITIPNSVTSIGNYAFNGCTYLEKIHYNAKNIDNLTSNSNLLCYAGTAGNGIEVTFGSDVEKIPYYLLHTDYDANNPKIVSISLPDSLTTIDSEAFSGFNELISLNIPDTITSIGEKAFYNCTSLKNLNIPDSVTHIGNYAFAESCITQTKLTLPKTLETIGEGAFNGWSSLEEIKMPFVGAERGISGTKDAVFGHIFGITDNTENSTFQTFSMGGQNYQIPNTLRKVTVTDETIIPYGAFSGCGFLTDIVIEGSPSTIMSHAFSDYYNLFNVYVKSKTVKYSDTAFKYSEFPTLYGFTGSTTETFANDNSFDFVSIDDMEAETYNISAKTQVIENNIVFNVKTDKTIYDKMVHIAIYDDTQSLSDYIIIPNYDSFNEVNVVFKNRSDISFAKVFLWESPTSITPITEALRININ
ncbi:MAG: leucine-rich repeat protein, partial [Clostridia bacterium]|nr:leucine-rich repeat protein [Clostridia bacterium]